jgi:hypothetical protein
MAIKVNQKDIKTIMCPAVNGVRKEAQAVRIYRNGAWVDVWSNIKIMTVLSNNITKGWCALSEDKRTIQYHKFMDGANNGSMAGGGTIVFYLDGLWTNPTITFTWSGSYMYQLNDLWYVISAGSISLYHRTSGSSNAVTTSAVPQVGTTQAGTNDPQDASGSYEKTLSGTYDRLGLSIYVNGFSGTKYGAYLMLFVSDLMFGGQKIGFPDSVVYNDSGL